MDGEPLTENTVLVLAPVGKDAALASTVLRNGGLAARACASVSELCDLLTRGGDSIGALLLTEETLASSAELGCLAQWLREQAPWSDLPVVILTAAGEATAARQRLLRALQSSGPVTVLERPMRPATLISSLQVALRARTRQFQVRDLLAAERRAAAALESAKTDAEKANQLKDQFLATLSHELRTPLNAILGWVHLLRGETDEETLQTGFETIERNARAQVAIVDDVLDVSRIITGKMRLEIGPVELPVVVASVLETVRPAAVAKGVALRPVIEPGGSVVQGDPVRLGQVIWNLLSNAIKFTPRGGTVEIAVRRARSQTEIVVSDTGRGIEPGFLPHVFDRFRQADSSSTRSHGGLGLGLAIVRHLVELHGGTVEARSAGPDGGATFIVRLPVLAVTDFHDAEPPRRNPEAGGAAATQPPAASLALAGVRVLAVDDDADGRQLLRVVLARSGAQVSVASSADEALTLMRRGTLPDVLLSDIEMPQEDGYSLISKIRALPAGEGGGTPAIALTAYAREEDRARALQAGFQLHVTKPVAPSDLIAAVGNLLPPHRRVAR